MSALLIHEPMPDVKRPKKDKNSHFIFFYGSENYAWVPYENVCSYIGNIEKFMMKTKIPKGFLVAIEAIDDAVKALSEEDRLRVEDLPSIEEEISKIFPSRPAKSLDTEDIKKDPTLGKKQGESSAKESFCNSLKLKARKSEGDAIKVKNTRKSTEVNGSTEKPKRKRLRDRASAPNGTDGPSPKKTPKIFKHKNAERQSSKKKSPIKPMKSLTPSEKLLKKARSVATITASPQIAPKKHLSPGSPTKIKPRKIPDLSRLSEGDFSSLMPDYHLSSAMQSEDSLLGIKSPVKSVIPTPMRIGFLGLGIMGQGMVMNLLRSGHEVTVWNRTSLKIVFGSSGVLKGISVGKCFVEMSTIDEETVQDVAEAIQARGGVYLEAPVVGSRVPALEGQLIVLASGDRKLFDDCFSCFEAIGKKSLYLGSDPGAATRMKLIVNMVMGTVVASLAEGMAMAEKVGLDQEDVAEVLAISSLSCPTINHKAQAILNQKYDPHFPLQHQQKDMRLSLQLGDKVEQPLYLAAAANELYKKARRLGYGDSDMSAVFRAASN